MANKAELKEKFADGQKPTGADFAELIDGVEGPQGPAGTVGERGPQGDPGVAGKDGFGTEEQYDEIISRLEALEEAVTGE